MSYLYKFFLVALICAHAYSYTPLHKANDDKCEALTFDICRTMSYNRTIFPNYFGHRKQSEAMKMVAPLKPLLKIGCSPDMLTFVCSVYFPMCTSINKIIPPCRSLCLDVQKGCLGVLKRFGYSWPNDLKCDQFPLLKTDICVFKNKTASATKSPFTLPKMPGTSPTRRPKVLKKVAQYCPADKVKSKQWSSNVQRNCCKCCMRGNRAARSGIAKCTLKKNFSKAKNFVKSLKECPSRKLKRCYSDCCNAKKREILKKKANSRRNRNRRNRNRRNRKRKPVG